MHHQHHVVHFFGVHGGHHVRDVGFQINVRVQQVGTFTDPGQGDGMDAVTRTDEARQHPLPTPGPVPRAMYQ